MSDDERSYSLPTQTIPGLDLSHHLADLLEIQSFLGSRGIPTKNTRIERYRRYLERVIDIGPASAEAEKIFKNSAGEPFLTSADWYLYVLREVHELMWILKGLKAHLPKGVDDKLAAIAGGRDFAALDVDSQSRNAQFELRIASYFCQAGCEVDVSTDTDVVALRPFHELHVECKRVGSKSQLGKRLSEARAQLAARIPKKDGKRLVLGCVAAEVTKVGFAHNGLTFAITSEHSRDVIRDKLLDIAKSNDRALSFDSPRKLLSYWLQIHISSLVMMPPPATFGSRFSSYHIARPRLSRKDAKALMAFYALVESVSKEDARASAPQQLTRRTTVQFPAGTGMRVSHDRILKLLEQADLTAEEYSEVVAGVSLNNNEHQFTFAEVVMLPREIIDEWKETMSVDRARSYALLIARLYLQRFPYEESV